jgi:hypothetical protein
MKRLLLIAALVLMSIPLLAGTPTLNTSIKVLYCPGPPDNGTSCIQTITFGGTPDGGGSFVLRFNNQTTAPINWSATNATLVSNIDTALKALSSIGPSGISTAVGSMTAGIGTITVTFAGKNAKLSVPTMTVPNNTLTGTSPTVSVATTTAGVTADGRNQAGLSYLLVDHTNGNLYLDRGSTNNPNWTQITIP